MTCHSYGNNHHETFEPEGVEDVGAKEEREPQHGENIYFDTTGNHLFLAEITDVRAQFGMTHQPII